jgi:hypothetical protein
MEGSLGLTPISTTQPLYHSTIPLFHYSWLEEKEWLARDTLLSSIPGISDTFINEKSR